MLAELNTSRPPIENGALSASWIRKAMALACCSSLSRAQKNGELVAAQARERIRRTQARLEPPRHGDEQLVADEMAEAVVHHLEAIEVEIQHREPIAAAPPLLERLELMPELLDEHAAVAQPGERVAEPGAAELLLFLRTLSRIGQRSGHAGGTPIRAARGDAAAEETPVGPVLMPDAMLELEVGRRARDVRLERLLERHDVLVMDTVDPFLRTGDAGRRLEANHGLPAARDVELLAAEIPFPEAVIRAFSREREPLFASLDRLFRPRAIGNVMPDHGDAIGNRTDGQLQHTRPARAGKPDMWKRARASIDQGVLNRARELGCAQNRQRLGERSSKRSFARTPAMRSRASFQKVIRPLRSTTEMPSSMDSITSSRRYSSSSRLT